MNFRAFIYYCALCGAWCAIISWFPGRLSEYLNSTIAQAGIKGLCLGLFLALGLSTLDAAWNLSLRQFIQIGLRITVAVIVGLIGGMVGGIIGQALANLMILIKVPLLVAPFSVLGWALTGLLIGASLGICEMATALMFGQDPSGAMKKIFKGVIGGSIGGLLGGTLSILLGGLLARLLSNRPSDELWLPSATGFTILGACIGLLIGITQVILKEAWIKIEKGRRAGREILVTKNEIVLGRAESCDIGLFGDNGVEKVHARIKQQRDGYLLTDMGSPGGTYVNGRRVDQPTLLQSGDQIQLGGTVLRFGERARRK
jgi:hypothetical protein